MRTLIALIVVCFVVPSFAMADSQDRFARRLRVGPLRHAKIGRHGPEVVFRSSGRATPEAAMSSWATSPGHAALINSGQISRVVCNGRVCVGR
jgi:hypothetical protein